MCDDTEKQDEGQGAGLSTAETPAKRVGAEWGLVGPLCPTGIDSKRQKEVGVYSQAGIIISIPPPREANGRDHL